MDIEKWADRIYLEEDFGKNIATTICGLIGLSIYLYSSDFALAAFFSIIFFPAIKIFANMVRSRWLKKREALENELKIRELDGVFASLTDQERRVAHVFCGYKSAVVSEDYLKLNSTHVPDGAAKSLMKRGFLKEVSYGSTYDLELDLDIFEAARRYFGK